VAAEKYAMAKVLT